jgi:hypothetical protein
MRKGFPFLLVLIGSDAKNRLSDELLMHREWVRYKNNAPPKRERGEKASCIDDL